MEVFDRLKLKEALKRRAWVLKAPNGWEEITRFGESLQDILDWRNLINLFEFLAFLAGLLCLVFIMLLVSRWGAARQVFPHLCW